tara:strand:- start:7647 stop:8363 length:717 start_codon:yes stop_codon:yes gene_type:complete
MATKTKELSSELPEDIVSAAGDDIVTGKSELIAPYGAELVGEWATEDISFPRLQIAQGVGPLSDDFAKGDVVLEGEHKILSMDDGSIEFTVLRITKTYEENIAFDSGDLPRVAASREEVISLGGTTEWDSGNPPSFKPCADALVCIKGDPSQKSLYPYNFDGDVYTFAQWKIKGVAYTRAAKPIITAATMYYRAGLKTGTFLLSTEKEVFNGNTVAVPRVVRGLPNSKGFIEFLGEFA